MPRRGGHRGLILKTKRARQLKGRRRESQNQKEANARAARQGR